MQQPNIIIIPTIPKTEDKQGSRILKKFLKGTMEQFAILNENIDKACGAYPFEYSELQLQSVVFSSFVNIFTYPYAEYPIKRMKETGESSGRVDFWVHYNDDNVFLIEYKHTHSLFDSEESSDRILEDWKTAIEDVKAITKESIHDMELGNTNLYELAMMTVRLEQVFDKPGDIRAVSEEEAAQQVTKLCANLNPKPDWIMCWVLRKELQQKQRKWEKQYWSYPAVYLCVWSQGPIEY